MKLALALVALLLVSVETAVACPAKNGIPDYNCDGRVKITFLGDSLVFGIGDTKNGNKGGYVLRVTSKLPNVEIASHGVAGQRTKELLNLLRDTFDKNKKPEIREDLLDADVVILDLGRNDRWLFGRPSDAYRNIKRATTKILTEVEAVTGIPPLVVKAVIMLPNRGSQGPWVKELDKLIFKSNSPGYPADLRFDLVSKRLLSSDQIHPTSKGYDALAKAFLTYAKDKLPKKMAALRPDSDDDGIEDLFESSKFGTNPSLADSDGDLRSDGDEIFLSFTNPLVAD